MRIFANFCCGCGGVCKAYLCDFCESKLPFSNHVHMPKIAGVDQACAVFIFEDPIKNWIHRFKFQGDLRYGDLFSALMCKSLKIHPKVDYIIPVPQHPQKTKKRGFNQSLYLTQKISNQTGMFVEKNWLYRAKNTPSQMGSRIGNRKKNVKNAFKTKSSLGQVDGVLVVDDVLTTGSTIQSLARTIKKQNPDVFIQLWVLAKT